MSSMKKELVSGVLYNAVAKYAGIIVSLVVTGVLSRLLTPDDFGIVAVATVIITFFGIFSDLGIAPAVIQYKNLDKADLNSIFSFTVWLGLLISLLFFGSSWLISAYYKSSPLLLICQILSVNLLFAAMNIVPNALLYKEKRFRFIAFRSLFVQIAGGAIAVTAALSGLGIYSLLINPVFSAVVLFVINYRQNPLRVEISLGTASLRKIFSFSSYQFLFNVINYFTRNLDKLLIGKYMSLPLLGYYEKSYRLMMLPLQNITHVITPVMHPVFSDFQNDYGKLSESYLKVVRLLAFIGFPLSVFLFFTGQELILIIFGNQWMPSVPVFRILALSVGIQIVLSTSGSIFQAAGSTKVMFWSGALSAVLNVAAICLGIFWFRTLEAVAWCICVSFTINFIQAYYLMYYHTFRLSWLPFWGKFISPIVLSAVLAGALYLYGAFAPIFGMVLAFALKAVLTGVIWVVYVQYIARFDLFGKLSQILRKK